jgi:hypothetical protein
MILRIGQGPRLITAPIIALCEKSFPNEPESWSGQFS